MGIEKLFQTAGSVLKAIREVVRIIKIRDQNGTRLLEGNTVQWVNGAGDANEDGQFDQFDVIEVLRGGRYLANEAATWSQGDWNGDGVFNQFDIILAQQTQPPHYLRGPFAAFLRAR